MAKQKKRTLKFTDEEISHLQNAIAIAELHYSDIHKNLCKTKNVRHNKIDTVENEAVKFYWSKVCLFADINVKIQISKFTDI